MKKHLLLALLPLMLATGCKDEPAAPLPPASEGTYTVKLTADNSTLTTDDSTGPIQVELSSNEDANVKYKFEITAPCYVNTKSEVSTQIGVRQGAMIKSVSTYQVEKITVDFFASKGQNYKVFNNVERTGDELQPHVTNMTPVDPNDGGAVYEFSINSNGWCIYNDTSRTPTFYYISVVFKK